jgi:hypothetical protein
MDVSIHKGYVQVNAAYKNVTDPNKHFCEVFDRMMRLGPIARADEIKKKISGKIT